MRQYTKYHEANKQVSMTGARAFLIFEYLSYKPRSFEEIRDRLVECGFVNKYYSVDTIRVDLNTLKAIGCEITKATKTNDYKYELVSHPFKLKVSTKELSTLKKVYKKLIKSATPKMLLDFHFMFQKIANLIEDNMIAEQILGISLLKSAKTEVLKELLDDENKYNKVVIEYATTSKKISEYEITPEKLGIRSNRLYLYCYNHTLKKRSFLSVSNIRKIINKIFDKNIILGFDVCMKFQLKNYQNHFLENSEEVIEYFDDYIIVKGKYFNEFIAKQRALSLGFDCVVLEPEKIREDIIKTLKEMRSIYE